MQTALLALALLTKVNGSGFVPPDDARDERCDIYADKVVVTKGFGYAGDGGITVAETHAIAVTGDIPKVISRAAAEPVTSTPNGLCDAPITTIQAGDLVLFTNGGCGEPRQERKGTATSILRDVLDVYCPKTFDSPVR